MAINTITSDYTGRKRDLHIMQGVAAPLSSTIIPSFGRVSNYCTGIQKLIQRYTISLLTELGSQPEFTTFGSNLLSTLKNSNYQYNLFDVYRVFNFANIKVIQEFREYQRTQPNLSEDEQLHTAILDNAASEGDSLSLRIKVYPVQKTPVDFILPIPLT